MQLRNAIADLSEESIDIVKRSLEKGEDPHILIEEIRIGLEIVGKRFSKGQYYMTELIVAGETSKECIEFIEPKLSKTVNNIQENVVLGTVEGDIHDLGKNIVKAMLIGAGFKVYDLGVDVSPDKFVLKVQEVNARIIGLSTLMSSGIENMKKCIEKVKQNDSVTKVMIGGGPISGDIGTVTKYVKADAAGKDAIEAVKFAKKWKVENNS